MNNNMNDIVNDKKDHNIVNDSFAHKPDGLLVIICQLPVHNLWVCAFIFTLFTCTLQFYNFNFQHLSSQTSHLNKKLYFRKLITKSGGYIPTLVKFPTF